MKNQYLKEKRDEVKGSISGKVLRALDLSGKVMLTSAAQRTLFP